MTTVNTAVIPSELEILQAREKIFHGNAWRAKKPNDDHELREAALRIINEHWEIVRTNLNGSGGDLFVFEANADMSIQLLAKLPPPRSGYASLAGTREQLWQIIFDGLEQTPHRHKEWGYAYALLRTPNYTESVPWFTHTRRAWEAVVRERFAEIDIDRLVRMWSAATIDGNELLIRKAWQTFGARLPIRKLFGILAGGSSLAERL